MGSRGDDQKERKRGSGGCRHVTWGLRYRRVDREAWGGREGGGTSGIATRALHRFSQPSPSPLFPGCHRYMVSTTQEIARLWNRHGAKWCETRAPKLSFVHIPEGDDRPLEPTVPLDELRRAMEGAEKGATPSRRRSRRRKCPERDPAARPGKRNREDGGPDESELEESESNDGGGGNSAKEDSDGQDEGDDVDDGDDREREKGQGLGRRPEEEEEEEGGWQSTARHSFNRSSPPKKRARACEPPDAARTQQRPGLHRGESLHRSSPDKQQRTAVDEFPESVIVAAEATAAAADKERSTETVLASLRGCAQTLLDSARCAEKLLFDKDAKLRLQRQELSKVKALLKGMTTACSLVERERDTLKDRERELLAEIGSVKGQSQKQHEEDVSRHGEQLAEIEKRFASDTRQRIEAVNVEHEREIRELSGELARTRAALDKERKGKLEIFKAAIALHASVADNVPEYNDMCEAVREARPLGTKDASHG